MFQGKIQAGSGFAVSYGFTECCNLRYTYYDLEPALINKTDRAVNYTQVILYNLSLLLMSVNAALGRIIMAVVSCCSNMTL
jgi:hypothetical protein